MARNVTVVLDAQAGSCGKGKFIGYIAQKDNPHVSVCNFMSNAGHTYVDCNIGKVMTQQLPTSIVNKDTIICIGPESAITPDILFKEIFQYKDIIGSRKIYIHPNAVVIYNKHRHTEQKILRSGSTFKGCGAARADKIMRQALLFGKFWHMMQYGIFDEDFIEENDAEDLLYCCTTGEFDILNDIIEVTDTTPILNNDYPILVEGSQGCDLDINFGLPYPHTTSRQCHAGQLVADCGISPMRVKDIIMIMRPYPIRISNTTNIKGEDGNALVVSSGDYCGSPEITWDEIKKRCGAPSDADFGEQTTVTKKTRRVFEMNWDRMKYVVAVNRPTQIALNFVQYIDWDALHCRNYDELPIRVKSFIADVEDILNVPVTLIGTGSHNCDIIDRRL